MTKNKNIVCDKCKGTGEIFGLDVRAGEIGTYGLLFLLRKIGVWDPQKEECNKCSGKGCINIKIKDD